MELLNRSDSVMILIIILHIHQLTWPTQARMQTIIIGQKLPSTESSCVIYSVQKKTVKHLNENANKSKSWCNTQYANEMYRSTNAKLN